MATATNYGNFGLHCMKGEIALLTDNIKVTLHTNAYTPNKDTHNAYTDLTNELTTANGYTAGGLLLSSKAITYTAGVGAWFDAADSVWTITAGGITCRTAVLRKDSGTGSTSWLIGWIDMAADKTTSNDTFQIQYDLTSGVTFMVAA